MLAFAVLAMITGALGFYAVQGVVESGRLVVRTYDKPLMAISYARLAQADFNALELAIERLARDPDGRDGPDARIIELDHAVRAEIGVAVERSATLPSAAAGQTAAQAFDAWRALRAAPQSIGQQEALREQTARVLENLKGVLTAAGSSLDKVVKTTVFLKDMGDFAKMNEVYSRYFSENPPARSTIEAARLPRDAKVEIDCIAYKPK